MVLHHNINLGQRVEVKIGYSVFRGMVKYKGTVVGRKGEWVGVSLDVPAGDNDGMVLGRRYFSCNKDQGVFVRANCVRFIPVVRRLFNKYHRVRENSYVEEPLFGSAPVACQEPPRISNRYQDQLQSRHSFDDLMTGPKTHPLLHSVGNKIPAATMRRPKTAMSQFSYLSSPIHREYAPEGEFISTPTIPKTHMPHSALRNQVQRGWDGSHYVREMSVGTGRDSMKLSQWNDISY
ncbi:dynactin subunit 1-like [Ylistrum balloti]|uniref:dynactin subunit 1-like n=1 Tax=Ylistrum balloti TaxID=509963 RepID=UPI0029059EFE|nr:dynactin subunit 1-like [Ylistrum balloti]